MSRQPDHPMVGRSKYGNSSLGWTTNNGVMMRLLPNSSRRLNRDRLWYHLFSKLLLSNQKSKQRLAFSGIVVSMFSRIFKTSLPSLAFVSSLVHPTVVLGHLGYIMSPPHFPQLSSACKLRANSRLSCPEGLEGLARFVTLTAVCVIPDKSTQNYSENNSSLLLRTSDRSNPPMNNN